MKMQLYLKKVKNMIGFVGNIEELTENNTNFRQVVYTGQHSQLVLMCLNAGEEIGVEVHEIVDQFLRIETGGGKVILNGEEHLIKAGDAIVVPAGVEHNVINTSEGQMKLYTVYSPAHHKDGTVHKTKTDAENDKLDFI